MYEIINNQNDDDGKKYQNLRTVCSLWIFPDEYYSLNKQVI